MKCERCNIDMNHEKVYIRLGYGEEHKLPTGVLAQDPISVKSVNICPQCGKIELNINE